MHVKTIVPWICTLGPSAALYHQSLLFACPGDNVSDFRTVNDAMQHVPSFRPPRLIDPIGKTVIPLFAAVRHAVSRRSK